MLCVSVLFDESANAVMLSPQRCPDNSVADPEISFVMMDINMLLVYSIQSEGYFSQLVMGASGFQWQDEPKPCKFVEAGTDQFS